MSRFDHLVPILEAEQDFLSIAYADIQNGKEGELTEANRWTPHEALKTLVFMVRTNPQEFEELLPRLRKRAKELNIASFEVSLIE